MYYYICGVMTTQEYNNFWSARPFKIIGSYPLADLQTGRNTEMHARLQTVEEKRSAFLQSDLGRQVADRKSDFSTKGEALHVWAVNKSWSFCSNCNLLHRQTLLPSFQRSRLSTVTSCSCSSGRYHVPQAVEIPLCLQNLTKGEIIALRPFSLHTGNYKVHQHGYRQKDGFCRVTWCEQSVDDKISELEPSSRLKCMLAYRYLTTSPISRYNHFILLREQHINSGKQLNMYDYSENNGIECALWPHLYPFHEWCETRLTGNTTRQSAKISFCCKILSEILDYSLDYDLLQFVYDRWLFTTVSGAISSARQFDTSAPTSLSSKTFSIEYWRWQHRYLIDAVRQYGYPDVFITISPYEWTFPTPKWLQNAAEISGKLPTQLASLETLNIVHILEQTVRGYLCGTNSMRWREHVFNYSNAANNNNVKNFFYRIEFQGRGTAHVHLLIWLEDISKASYDEINAHIPLVDRELSFLVYDLQRSEKTALSLNEMPTSIATESNDKAHLSLHYPHSALALKLRAYISSVIPFLKCRMDVQFSDQSGMLMRYVTSYVSKFKDSQTTESMYSTHLVPAMAAYRHLRDMKPCEPEMIMTLSSVKMAWCSNGTKMYTPPRPAYEGTSSPLQKYHNRDEHLDISFIDYLRTHDTSKSNPPPYKRQKCLVGVKFVSYFNSDFFFQFLVMNKVHRNLEELKHPNHDRLPVDLKYFGSCIVNFPDLFTDTSVRDMLQKEGHKSYFIANVVSYIENMKNIYHLWQIQVLSNQDFSSSVTVQQNYELDQIQTLALNNLKSSLRLRLSYYQRSAHTETSTADSTTHDWTKILSITGKPGTGKTRCLHACIKYLIDENLKCLVATPTGFLASSYRALFDVDIDANTLHSSFSVPIDDSPPQVNWALSMYDVIMIDEVSMVSLPIFTHILSTLQQLPTRPILVICGDKYQLPPITTRNNRVVSSCSIYEHSSLSTISISYNFTHQYRCVDEEYCEILNHLRHWKPTPEILRTLQSESLLHQSNSITDSQLLAIIRENASSTFLTVSRSAVSKINNLILKNVFSQNHAIANIQMDNDEPPTDIYKGMRVLITQNRDKKNGIVNGQPAVVLMRENMTILLQLPNGRKVSVYPVTSVTSDINDPDSDITHYNTCYPFVAGYAMTICKSQGQTLENVVVWFDCERLGPGTAYVALSRVKRMQNIKFLTPLMMSHFQPVML